MGMATCKVVGTMTLALTMKWRRQQCITKVGLKKKTEAEKKMMILLCDCCYVLWINNLFVEEDKFDEMIVELI